MDASSSQPFPPDSTSPPPDGSLTDLVNQVLEDRHITQAQYQNLSAMVLADGTVDEAERRQINRLFDAIQKGRVTIR
ncbi:MAG: hypothetical protein VKI82_00460 [Leptolyngbya sp.]|nr:hypothetical protein [Leptolyngbya sp.]